LLINPFGKHVGIGSMFVKKLKYQILLCAIYIINLAWSQKHHQVLIMLMKGKPLKKNLGLLHFFYTKKLPKKKKKKNGEEKF
jgi:hypothetical protein